MFLRNHTNLLWRSLCLASVDRFNAYAAISSSSTLELINEKTLFMLATTWLLSNEITLLSFIKIHLSFSQLSLWADCINY